jgi:hypothetical protein
MGDGVRKAEAAGAAALLSTNTDPTSARITGVPANTVRTRIFYAHRHVAKLLAARGMAQACL